MQKRKILFIGLLAIFAIVIAGSASAFDLGFLTGDSGPETVTIEGIDFNIPEGYKEDENYSYVNETASSGSVKYVMMLLQFSLQIMVNTTLLKIF